MNEDMDAVVTALALPVLTYRRAKNKTCRRTGSSPAIVLFLYEAFYNLISVHTKHDSNQSKALQKLTL